MPPACNGSKDGCTLMQRPAQPDRHTLIEVLEIRFDVQPDDALFDVGSAGKKGVKSDKLR